VWNQLRNRSGWTCDQITGELHTSEAVWAEEIRQNPQAKKLHSTPMPNCWELDEIFTGSIVSGEMAFPGGDLKERFPGQWKERETTGSKRPAKAQDTPSSTILLSKAIEEFCSSQGATCSSIRRAVRPVMDTNRVKVGWAREKIDKALDLFKQEAMPEIFNELEMMLIITSTGCTDKLRDNSIFFSMYIQKYVFELIHYYISVVILWLPPVLHLLPQPLRQPALLTSASAFHSFDK